MPAHLVRASDQKDAERSIGRVGGAALGELGRKGVNGDILAEDVFLDEVGEFVGAQGGFVWGCGHDKGFRQKV